MDHLAGFRAPADAYDRHVGRYRPPLDPSEPFAEVRRNRVPGIVPR